MTIENEGQPTPAELDKFAKDAEIPGYEPASKPEETPEVTPEPAKEPEVNQKEETPEVKPKEDESKIGEDPLDTEEEEDIKPNKTRVPKTMLTYKHKIAEKNWAKEKDTLNKTIEDLKNKPSDTPIQQENLDKDIQALAEETGLDEKVLKKIINLRPTQSIPTDLTEKLAKDIAEVNELKESLLDNKSELDFNNDFTNDVLPLIKSEYGDISDSDLAILKKRMKNAATMEDYVGTNLALLYKGLDNFRPKVGKKSAEPTDGGKARSDGTMDYSNVSDDQVEKWTNSNAPADKKMLEDYFAYQDSHHKES